MNYSKDAIDLYAKQEKRLDKSLKITGDRNKIKISFLNSLLCGIITEAVNENVPLFKLKSFCPISSFEIELTESLSRYHPIFSYIIYLYFYKMQKISIMKIDEKNMFEVFFVDMSIVYIIQNFIEDNVKTSDFVSKYLKEFSKIGAEYSRVLHEIGEYLYYDSGEKHFLLDKNKLHLTMKSYKNIEIRKNIRLIVKNIYNIARRYYSKKANGDKNFIGSEVSDIFLKIKKDAALKTEIIAEEEPNKYTPVKVVSINPLIWMNDDMSTENFFTMLIAKKMLKENKNSKIYKNLKISNLFYYFFQQNDGVIRIFLIKNIENMYKADIFGSKEITSHIQDKKAFKAVINENFYNIFLSQLNLKQIMDDNFSTKIRELLKIEKTKMVENQIVDFLFQAIYSMGKIFTYDKKYFLFYDKNKDIMFDKDVVKELSNIIKNNLKKQQ